MKKAVILLSGGLDSSTTLYYAKEQGFSCYGLIFDYGQRHRKEVKAAKIIAQNANCKWQIVKIALPWKGSSLLDDRIKIAGVKSHKSKVISKIPNTYVPGRNIIFLSFALSHAEAIGAKNIFIGANSVDFSGYPDCRPEFYRAFNKVALSGTKAGCENKSIKIITPLINKTKAEIVVLGKKLKVPFQLTWSCYHGEDEPCGKCDSCYLRAKGFREADLKDPLIRDNKEIRSVE